MNPDDNSFLGEPIPLEPEPEKSTDAKHGGSAGDDIFAPPPGASGSKASPSRIHTFETDSTLTRHAGEQLKRALHKTGAGATRVRTFHAKLADTALSFMDEQINEWLDSHEDIEVKFCSTTVGVVEGKRAESHLIVTVWY